MTRTAVEMTVASESPQRGVADINLCHLTTDAINPQFFKSLTGLIAAGLILTAFVTSQDRGNAYQTERFQTSSSPSVEIGTAGGSITVTGHDEDYTEVRMYVQRRGNYLTPSDTDLSGYSITIEQDGDRIIAFAEREGGWTRMLRSNQGYSISFDVLAPRGADVSGQTSGGGVRAEGIENRISLKTSGGSVRAADISGVANFETSGGSVRLERISGELSARTSGGSIRAEKLTGEADLRTSGGSIRMENIDAKLSARTSGGSIRAQFDSFHDDIDLRTSGGSINIRIPKTDHFDVNLTGMRVNANLDNFSGSSGRRSLNGKVGNGGPVLSARTSGGSVSLNTN